MKLRLSRAISHKEHSILRYPRNNNFHRRITPNLQSKTSKSSWKKTGLGSRRRMSSKGRWLTSKWTQKCSSSSWRQNRGRKSKKRRELKSSKRSKSVRKCWRTRSRSSSSKGTSCRASKDFRKMWRPKLFSRRTRSMRNCLRMISSTKISHWPKKKTEILNPSS